MTKRELDRIIKELENHPAFESDAALDRWLEECGRKYPMTDAQRAFIEEAGKRGKKRLMARVNRSIRVQRTIARSGDAQN